MESDSKVTTCNSGHFTMPKSKRKHKKRQQSDEEGGKYLTSSIPVKEEVKEEENDSDYLVTREKNSVHFKREGNKNKNLLNNSQSDLILEESSSLKPCEDLDFSCYIQSTPLLEGTVKLLYIMLFFFFF